VRGFGTNVRTRYAIQAIIYLARQERLQVVPVSEIAAAAAIPPKFLEDILAALRTAGIVRSRRGKEGGYLLVPAPSDLSVLEIVQALDGSTAVSGAEGRPAAQVTARVFDRANEVAAALLASLTMDQLIEETRALEAEHAQAYMYHL
jgi:Rrf2 family protein